MHLWNAHQVHYKHRECHSVLVKLHPITVYSTFFGSTRFLCWMPLVVSFGFTIVSCSMIIRLILGCLWPLVFILNNILTLGILRSAISPPRMFLLLDLLSEYWIQHGTIGPLYVTSGHSIRIFYRGVSGFAIDCPCGVWCQGLTTCLLYVGPLLENRLLNNSWVVGFT